MAVRWCKLIQYYQNTTTPSTDRFLPVSAASDRLLWVDFCRARQTDVDPLRNQKGIEQCQKTLTNRSMTVQTRI